MPHEIPCGGKMQMGKARGPPHLSVLKQKPTVDGSGPPSNALHLVYAMFPGALPFESRMAEHRIRTQFQGQKDDGLAGIA